MAQFFTDKYLKYRAALQGRAIDTDKPCDQCEYNLRGLRYGGVCPECGTPIRFRRDADLAFDELPLPLIKKFRLSTWMATGAVGGVLVVPVARYMLPAAPGGYEVAVIALIVLWFVAVWRLTEPLDMPQAAIYGLSKRSWLRRAARWLQGGWALAAVAGKLAAATPAVALAVTAGGAVLGIVGVVALALHLARFAGWVRDDFAGKAFNLAVFGIPFAVMLSMLVPLLGVSFGVMRFVVIPLVVVPIALLLAASILAFPVGLLSLNHALGWSVVHARARAERSRELHERMAPRPAPIPPPPDPIELAEPSADPPPIQPVPSTNVVVNGGSS
ncbi:MAG: hypothetical protein IH983_00970 [Planctomycetes bacterium]|nr:hypothetical protein [Planctomycetota bacterium]